MNSISSEEEVLAKNEAYFDKIAYRYEEKIKNVFGPYSQKRMDNIVKYLASFNNNHFIDLGCGTGNLLKYGHRCFKKAIGYDVSKNMLRIARKNRLMVKRKDINDLDLKSKVDVVASSSILHHILYPEKLLGKMNNVLKPKGFIYLENEPNAYFQESKMWRLYHNIRNIIEGKAKEYLNVYNKPVNPDLINKTLIGLNFKPKFYFYWTSANIFEKEHIPFKRKLLIFLISLLRMKFDTRYNSPVFSVIAQKI